MKRRSVTTPVRFLLAVLIAVVSAAGSNAQVKGVFYGADFGDSLDDVKSKLTEHCRSIDVVAVESPSFPLAGETEEHLICEGIELDDNEIEEVAFAFGDDKLSLIEARGGAVEALVGKATVDARTYLHYKAFFEDLMLADTKQDAVWLLSEESIHPNLFVWSNPYLPSNEGTKTDYERSAAIPRILKFGGNLDDLLPEFEKQCPILNVEKIAEPWLQTKPKTQTQINCFGYEYGGFPRKIEAVFGDDVLELAWILTGKGEEGRLRTTLVTVYREPEFVNEDWEAFNGWQIVLRKDKPEVLVVSEKLAPIFRELIKGQKK